MFLECLSKYRVGVIHILPYLISSSTCINNNSIIKHIYLSTFLFVKLTGIFVSSFTFLGQFIAILIVILTKQMCCKKVEINNRRYIQHHDTGRYFATESKDKIETPNFTYLYTFLFVELTGIFVSGLTFLGQCIAILIVVLD